jgi:hypothetical protein
MLLLINFLFVVRHILKLKTIDTVESCQKKSEVQSERICFGLSTSAKYLSASKYVIFCRLVFFFNFAN